MLEIFAGQDLERGDVCYLQLGWDGVQRAYKANARSPQVHNDMIFVEFDRKQGEEVEYCQKSELLLTCEADFGVKRFQGLQARTFTTRIWEHTQIPRDGEVIHRRILLKEDAVLKEHHRGHDSVTCIFPCADEDDARYLYGYLSGYQDPWVDSLINEIMRSKIMTAYEAIAEVTKSQCTLSKSISDDQLHSINYTNGSHAGIPLTHQLEAQGITLSQEPTLSKISYAIKSPEDARFLSNFLAQASIEHKEIVSSLTKDLDVSAEIAITSLEEMQWDAAKTKQMLKDCGYKVR